MPERFPTTPPPDAQRPRFDLSTIMGIPVGEIEVAPEMEAMASAYMAQLKADKTNKAAYAELAWAFRRQLQQDVGGMKEEDRKKTLATDETHAFSLALYRQLLTQAGDELQRELARHEAERVNANGTYESYRTIDRVLEKTHTDLNALLSDMFKRAGQEPKPVHLAKRALLESKIDDLESQLEVVKKKNPDVAALVEHDTIAEYATQLRTTGFIWTRSRHKLLHDVLVGALTSRPVAALMGETGTGKTAMARAASIELSSREPERTVGGDQEKFVRLLASPAIGEGGKTFWEYGPLLRAMTGRSSSIDSDASSKAGGIFFDDEFNTRPTHVQRQILKFVSEARAGRKVTIPGTPLTVTVESGFLYLAAGNPPSERYDREETGIETKREFAGNVLNVEYLEQTPDNPELYQVLLATLLDQKTKRLTAVTAEEVEPDWTKDAATGESHLNLDPKAGAFLWRFSQAWGELFKAFSHKDTILHKKHPADPKAKWHLPSFILDPGVVISWLDQYKADPKARKGHLSLFLNHKLVGYLSQFAEDEQKTVWKYLDHFGLQTSKAQEGKKPTVKVLTPREVGYVNPNVPRPPEKATPKKFENRDIIDPETGESVGTEPIPEREQHTREAGKVFAYDRLKAKEYGFSEITIEAHPKAQALIDALYARDPSFVTIHAIGTKDPDNKNTKLTVEKIKVNQDALKLYWQQHCSDLPDTPLKSDWFFQALAEHRLSNTIDADDTKTITTPTTPHIPAFGRPEFLLAMDWQEFDYDNASAKIAAITRETKVLLQKLFHTEDPTNLKRDDKNNALWSDHENRISSDKAREVITELLGPGQNPDDFELRLLRYDEYARAASSQGYGQKNLWTHFDGYYALDDGHRDGLDGGLRDGGGAARVAYGPRELRGEGLSPSASCSRADLRLGFGIWSWIKIWR